MDGCEYSLVLASAVRVCTVTARGLGMAVCIMRGAMQPRDVLGAAGWAVNVYI